MAFDRCIKAGFKLINIGYSEPMQAIRAEEVEQYLAKNVEPLPQPKLGPDYSADSEIWTQEIQDGKY